MTLMDRIWIDFKELYKNEDNVYDILSNKYSIRRYDIKTLILWKVYGAT